MPKKRELFGQTSSWYFDTPDGPGIDPTLQVHRWDCICTLPNSPAGFVGYLTAKPKEHLPGLSWQSIGYAKSDDGLNWQALPPAQVDWGPWPRMNCLEVCGFHRIGC